MGQGHVNGKVYCLAAWGGGGGGASQYFRFSQIQRLVMMWETAMSIEVSSGNHSTSVLNIQWSINMRETN